MAITTPCTVEYTSKSGSTRKYRAIRTAKSKYNDAQRVCLEFMDGSKSFWVDAKHVTPVDDMADRYRDDRYADPAPRPYYDGAGFTYCGYPCPVNGHICSPQYGPCHDCE